MSKKLPVAPDDPGRRVVVRRIGGWIVYVGGLTAMGAAVAPGCGRTPLGDPLGFVPIDDDDDDDGTTFTPTPTGSPTPIEPCGCPQVPGVAVGINAENIPAGSFAFNAGLTLFVCHDAGGFYAMTAICTHQSCNMGTMSVNMSYSNLAGGFRCTCHNSTFNANGVKLSGPPPTDGGPPDLRHYRMGVAPGTGDIFVDITPPFAAANCRCDANNNPA